MNLPEEEWLTVEGVRLDRISLASWRQGKVGLAAELGDFLEHWFSPTPVMELQSSGSSGKPKRFFATKKAMRAGAGLSCRIFGLSQGKTALLCLPLRYIAGKMMVVRALVAGLHLRLAEPSSTPLAGREIEVDFAPLTPMQATCTLAEPDGADQLERAKTVLLGGGFVDAALEDALQGLSCRAFASYGMTETLSHIALRALNGENRSTSYTPLPGVQIALTSEGTLSLTVPHLGIADMETNDLAEIAPDGTFRILGRRDAVINSGGIKIQAEVVEKALHRATGLTLLALPSPHPVLGQCVAILWEGNPSAEAVLKQACETLPRYHRPRLLRHVDAIPRTETGKLSRYLGARLMSELTPNANGYV